MFTSWTFLIKTTYKAEISSIINIMRYYEFYTCNLNEDFEINPVVQPATIYCISFSTRIAFLFLPKAMLWFDSFPLLFTTII